jgi:hypothetical protein
MAIIPWLLLGLLAGQAQASDLILERRYAEQLETTPLQGTSYQLKAGEGEFLALHLEANGNQAQGGLILLHGPGDHPDGLELIHSLRVGLPRLGWETLSLQMPLPGPGAGLEAYQALLPEVPPRIEAALSFYKARKIEHVVLLGHGLGAYAGLLYVGQRKPPQRKAVKGLVLLSLALDSKDDKGGAAMQEVELPVLDLYGANDQQEVLDSRELRRRLAGYANNKGYQQSEVLGADHLFQGQGETLLLRVRGWLGKKVPNPKPLSYKELKKKR